MHLSPNQKKVAQFFSAFPESAFCIFWKKFISKSSLLVVSEILRLFVNILTLDDEYSLSVKASV